MGQSFQQRCSPGPADGIDNDLYDRCSDAWWDSESFLHQLRVAFNPARLDYASQKLFRDLHLTPQGKTALEVGCGGGLLCEEIARMGFATTGIDPSGGALAAARCHAEAGGLQIRYQMASGELLPYANASYDVVFCCDVLEHVRDLPRVVAEVSRVLKPNGVFLYDTFHRNWASKLVAIKIAQEWPRWAFLPPRLHVWRMFIRPREMKSLLRSHHLAWKEHRGLRPNVSLATALRCLRMRARGQMSYAELGRRIHLVESRITAVMYMGYAIRL